jgi:hypothetical protein
MTAGSGAVQTRLGRFRDREMNKTHGRLGLTAARAVLGAIALAPSMLVQPDRRMRPGRFTAGRVGPRACQRCRRRDRPEANRRNELA